MENILIANILLLIVKTSYCFTSVRLFRNKLPILQKTTVIFKESVVAILGYALVLNSFMMDVLIICRANQWTGFYMIGTFVIKELRNALLLFKNVQRYLLLNSNSLEKKCMFFKNVYMLFENNCLSNESIFFKAAKSKYSLKKFLRTLH